VKWDNRWKSIAHPPGFTHSQSEASTRSPKEIAASYAALKQKRAWDLAISPAKSLPMQAFMLYMSGGGVQIFSMGIVVVLLSSPFKALASINTSLFIICHIHEKVTDDISSICAIFSQEFKPTQPIYATPPKISIFFLQYASSGPRPMEV
jgi:hypothetical protein